MAKWIRLSEPEYEKLKKLNELFDYVYGDSYGTSGTSGENGTSGSSGVSGTSGTSGISTDGTSGSSGTSGISTDGTSGTSGISTDGTSGTSGISTDGTSGTSGAMATLTRDLTYAQLVAAIAASELNEGESILITDYATKHNMYDGTTLLEEWHTETVEPLLVTATSSSTLDVRAKSVLFPKDIIHYDVSDNLCEDGTTDRTGKITFRQDHLGNETHYDFRGVMFRRWKFDLSGFTAWVSEGTFTRGDKITYNNKLYYCTNSITGSTDNPETLTSNFNYVTDNQRWLAWQTDVVSLGGDPVAEDAIYIPVDNSAYFDFYTFSDATGAEKSEWFKDMKLGVLMPSSSLSYNSIVFVETAIDQTYKNTFGINCYFMTFGNYNYYNTFWNDNNYITFGNGNSSNTFGNYNSYNTFGNNNSSNTFGNDNTSNTFGNGNYYITFGNDNTSNTFGNGNYYITFGNENYSNTFGNYNSYNTFGNNNSSNTFGNDNTSNTFGNGNYYNTFGNDNSYNTFGDENYSNTFGNKNYSNTFGNKNAYNTFETGNTSNTFGDGNTYNTFGNGNFSNIFGDGNFYNTFGNEFINNEFKNLINGEALDYLYYRPLLSENTHTEVFTIDDGGSSILAMSYYDNALNHHIVKLDALLTMMVSANGSALTTAILVMSKEMDDPSSFISDFVLKANGEVVEIDSIVLDVDIHNFIITPTTPFLATDVVTLSFTMGNVLAADGTHLASFADYTIPNAALIT